MKIGMEMRIAPEGKVRMYREGVNEVLDFIGHPEAFVTDWSTVGDFTRDMWTLTLLSMHTGIRVSDYTYVWQLGKVLQEGPAD